MVNDPTKPVRDLLGLPMWMGLWIAMTGPWLRLMLASRGTAGNWDFQLPRSANVYGYDGFIHTMYERYGSLIRIPLNSRA